MFKKTIFFCFSLITVFVLSSGEAGAADAVTVYVEPANADHVLYQPIPSRLGCCFWMQPASLPPRLAAPRLATQCLR